MRYWRTILPEPRRRCEIYHPYNQTHSPHNVRVSHRLTAIQDKATVIMAD